MIGRQGERPVYRYREVGGLLGTIAQPHRGNHVALSGNAHARATPHRAFPLYFLPQMAFGSLHLFALRVLVYLLQYQVYLFQLQVYDVVHDALSGPHVLPEQVEVEAGFGGERILHVAVQVDTEQTARVVGTKGNLPAGIGRHRAEAQVGIAVGNTLAQDGVPEQHTRFCALPGIMNYLLPKFAGRDFLMKADLTFSLLRGIYRPPLHILLVVDGSLHELIVDLHRDVGPRHLALGHLGIDEGLAVGMLDAHREHQRTTTPVLCHLARTITITLHERHQASRCQGRIMYGRTFRTDVA